MESSSRRNRMVETLKVGSFGSAAAIAAKSRGCAPRTSGAEQWHRAGVTGTAALQKRSLRTDMRLVERSAPSTRHGRRCTPDAAIQTTTAITDMAEEESRFVRNGQRLKGSLRIWARLGRPGFQSTGSTTTATTSQATANGQRRKSRPATARLGAEGIASKSSYSPADQYPFRIIAVTAKTKKAGGGWAIEEF